MSKALIEIGSQFKNIRKGKMLSQEQVYNDVGLAKKILHKIEEGILDDEVSYIIVTRYLKIYLKYFDINQDQYIKKYLAYFEKDKTDDSKIILEKRSIFPNNYLKISFNFIVIIFVIIYGYFYFNNDEKLLSEESSVLFRN